VDIEDRLHGLLGHRIELQWIFFLLRHLDLKEQVYAFPPKTIEDLMEGFQAAVTTVDVNTSTVVPRYTSLIRSRSLDLYQIGRIPNEFFP
jgi:hypothetical protein